MACVLWSNAAAAPWVPESDDVVLEQLSGPEDMELRALAVSMRAAFETPRELEPTLRFARAAIELGRRRSDPRLMGRAEAALVHFARLPEPAVEVRVLQATLLQNRHDFSAALAMLGTVLAEEPHHAQAWLTRAVIELVQGDPAASRESCTQLLGHADALIVIACVGQADARAGRARASSRALEDALARTASATLEQRKWLLLELGDVAARLGSSTTAERHLRAALALDPGDSATQVALADHLLDEGRPAEARSIVSAASPSDGVLLRRALAERALGQVEWQGTARELESRFAESRLRGAALHEREEARFALALRDDPTRALDLAQANFAVQREPADARILLEAAVAARQPARAQPAVEWLARTGLEDERIARLLAASAAIQ